MAEHLRTRLRRAVKAALEGLPSTGPRVFLGRTWPLDEADFPALLVYARGGVYRIDGQGDGDAGSAFERDERLVIEGVVRIRGEEPDDTLDRIEAEIAAALLSSPAVGALVEIREPVSSEIAARAIGEFREGSIKLVFRIVNRSPAGDLTTKV
jgi:hypothetical protein